MSDEVIDDENFINCEWCGDTFDSEQAENEGNHGIHYLCINCQDDSTTCYECDSITPNDNCSYTREGDMICESCIMRSYSWCDPCGEYYRIGNRCCNWDDDESDSVINDYGYQPNPKFFVKEVETNRIVTTQRIEFIRDTPLMGFELEIECDDSKGIGREEIALELLEKHSNWLYLKHDGSLNYGFEIVTHPHTLSAYNLRDWSWIEWLTNEGCSSWHTRTCGLHVHVNKSAFKTNSHIWKFTNLVLYNRNQASRLAGRKDNQWSSFYKEYKQVGKILKGERDPERYTAVNLRPFRTIEVRMFRGSLHEPRVRSALEFVNANFEYTKSVSSHDVLRNDALNWWAFTEWVQSNESTYPHLTTYLNKIKERSDRVSTML